MSPHFPFQPTPGIVTKDRNEVRCLDIIRLHEVSWIRGERTILNEINWTIQDGEHWALLGLNGSGKTSLLQIINGYQWPTRGEVTVRGKKFGKVDLREVRKEIGWVSTAMGNRFQADAPSEKAVDVVTSGKYASIGLWESVTEEDRQRAREILQRFSALHLADAPFQTLSQGERQRVLIARAFMAQPPLLILDEPCTGLDVRARENLLSSLSKAQRETSLESESLSIIYVTHHVEEILPFISHVLILDEGNIVAQGPKAEVLTDSTLSDAFHISVKTRWESERVWLSVE